MLEVEDLGAAGIDRFLGSVDGLWIARRSWRFSLRDYPFRLRAGAEKGRGENEKGWGWGREGSHAV